jgi:hypothetical protein
MLRGQIASSLSYFSTMKLAAGYELHLKMYRAENSLDWCLFAAKQYR